MLHSHHARIPKWRHDNTDFFNAATALTVKIINALSIINDKKT